MHGCIFGQVSIILYEMISFFCQRVVETDFEKKTFIKIFPAFRKIFYCQNIRSFNQKVDNSCQIKINNWNYSLPQMKSFVKKKVKSDIGQEKFHKRKSLTSFFILKKCENEVERIDVASM